jgi:sterol desaturase/sphingolipid hydroxylase (fatty acid hydroxylase superfamily)
MGARRRFSPGWASGVASTALGAMGLGAVLCLWFPSLLTTPELRDVYDMTLVRALIKAALLLAFALGVASLLLKRRKALGLTGIGLSLLATLMGGSSVPVAAPVRPSDHVGLDWFLLNVLILAMLFVPMEQLFARLPDQKIFRPGWTTDLAHFAVSHLLVQATVLLTLVPAAMFFHWAVSPGFQAAVAGQPAVLQFAEVLFIADLTQYWTHRLFHRVALLWGFHAIHHSSRHLDWLAGSRLHLVDIIVTRAVGFVPVYVLGFATAPTYFYLVFVSFQAVLIHANVRWRFGPLASVFVTPRFHHWHHADAPEAVDKNFAVHLPLIDRLFGTHYLPEAWPASYGIAGDPVPERYMSQLVYPFRAIGRALDRSLQARSRN